MTDSKQDYINYRLDRSVELFQDGKLLAKNKRWRSCVNRLYYSSFHLVNALLFQDGITAKSHDGLKTNFFQLYIKTNRIDPEYGKLYSKLMDWRQESDYSIYVNFDDKDVKPIIEKVEKLNHLLTEIISTKS
jgi:uncharacterized protein (UPF0332 family)